MDVFVSWSGGKDCCLACYRAIRSGLKVCYLASVITKHTGRLWPHLLTTEVLRMQAQAMGIRMVQWWTTVSEYNNEYKKMLAALEQEGIIGGVFGDVSIGNSLAENHKEWIEGVCRPTGITPYLPLWGQTRESLLREFIGSGFEAIIIAADNNRLGKEWLGRKLDKDLLSELKLRYELSPTGEVGYYHTFVVDGPLFKERLEILETDQVIRDGIWYLDILKCSLKSKIPASPVSDPQIVSIRREVPMKQRHPGETGWRWERPPVNN